MIQRWAILVPLGMPPCLARCREPKLSAVAAALLLLPAAQGGAYPELRTLDDGHARPRPVFISMALAPAPVWGLAMALYR